MVNQRECTRMLKEGIAQGRQWTKANPAVTVAAAVAVLILALLYLWYSLSGPSMRTNFDVYFYDLGTKQLLTVANTELAPIDTSSGAKMGVQAFVFGCGDCKAAHRFIGYLQRYTDAGKAEVMTQRQAAVNPATDHPPMPADFGMEVASVEGGKWVPRNSDAGQKVMEEQVGKHCPPGTRVVPCMP
jgi:hypothetical protein